MIGSDHFRSIVERVCSIAKDCTDQRIAGRIRLLARELEEIARTPESSAYFEFPDRVRTNHRTSLERGAKSGSRRLPHWRGSPALNVAFIIKFKTNGRFKRVDDVLYAPVSAMREKRVGESRLSMEREREIETTRAIERNIT
jgi:hypothetical protein